MKTSNPFLLKGYKSKELFCDRETELKRLCENIENGIVGMKIAKKACLELLERNEPTFLQYKELLTTSQWKYLIAIAKENTVEQLSAKSFLMKHSIGTPTDSQRLKQSLLDKDLILETVTKEQTFYQVSDVFFSRWLEKEFS